MKKCILIGGGNTGKGKTEYETKEIDKEIIQITGKENPTFLFIGLASSHSDSDYDNIKKIYQELGCNTIYLKKSNCVNNPDIVKNKIETADIIYIGGGDSIKLKKKIEEYQLERHLKNAYERGCTLVGISAGAILLSEEGFSDSYILRGESNQYKFIKGLNIAPIKICPHYHKSSEKTKELEEHIKKEKIEVYGLEDITALEIIDNKIRGLIGRKNKKIFICTAKENKEFQ